MRRLLGALVLAVGLLAAMPAWAGAGQDPGFQECLDKVPVEQVIERGPPSCHRVDGGEWEPYWPDSGGGGIGGLIAVFVVVALVWSAIPIFASYSLASSSGQSTGVAMLLGLVFGWAGLLAVYLMSRSDTRAAVHGGIDAMAPRPQMRWTPPAPGSDVGERLRTLDRLRDSGAIDDEEYAAQRAAIISGI